MMIYMGWIVLTLFPFGLINRFARGTLWISLFSFNNIYNRYHQWNLNVQQNVNYCGFKLVAQQIVFIAIELSKPGEQEMRTQNKQYAYLSFFLKAVHGCTKYQVLPVMRDASVENGLQESKSSSGRNI